MVQIKVGIIGGSGLDDPDILKNRKEKTVCTPFGSPSDSLILGEIDGVQCVLLARHGRKHSIMPSNVNYRANIWALKEEGCTHIVASTASGSLQEEYEPGDLVILDSFIDRTTSRKQTFHDGESNHPTGVVHIPMEPAFCERTRQLVIQVAKDLEIKVHTSGTAVVIEGPRFSSKAESHMHRQWGAHLANMTLVPEVVLAKEAGICYASIAVVTDYDCWRSGGEHVCVEDVLKTFQANVSKIIKLITAVIPKINKENWDDTIENLQKIIKGGNMLKT